MSVPSTRMTRVRVSGLLEPFADAFDAKIRHFTERGATPCDDVYAVACPDGAS